MKLLLTLFLSLVISFSILADATRVVTTERGTFTEPFAGEVGPIRQNSSLDDPVILWWRNLATGIFYSTSITTAQYAYSGSGLNDPREAAQYEIVGDGTPVNVLSGRGWKVAAAPHGGFWAALDTSFVDNRFVLYLMNDSVSTPIWTHTLEPGGAAGTDGLQFSEDGNILVLFYSRVNQMPKLLAWDMSSPDSIPIMDYDFVAGQGMYPRALEVSADGTVIAATADQYCTVIQIDGFVRNVIDFQASTDGLALSADGNFLMGAFTAAKLWRWDGSTYVLQWQWSVAGRYCSQLLISPDTTYAVTCWYPAPGYNRNYIRVHDIHTGALIWAYTYVQGSGPNQDWPIDADISADGNWFAVGSWGDQGNHNGEAVVFSRWYPTPYYELDMAGSCFSLDLSSDGRYLISGGKHVHANQFGNGGDLYVVDLDLPAAVPVISFVDTLIADTLVCIGDTIEFSALFENHGYGSFTVDSVSHELIGGEFAPSEYWLDSTLIGRVLQPDDTTALSMSIHVLWDFTFNDFVVTVYGSGTSAAVHFQPMLALCDDVDPILFQPVRYSLDSPYPNPFNSSTSLSFSLPREAEVNLVLVDILGREVETIANRSYSAGNHQLILNADNLASGIYFARLESPFGVRTQKLMLVR
jgi:hypothetical protein